MCIFIISFLLGKKKEKRWLALSIWERKRTWEASVFGKRVDSSDIYRIVIIVEFECFRLRTRSRNNPSVRNIGHSKANESLHSCPAILILLATNPNKKLITNKQQKWTLFAVFSPPLSSIQQEGSSQGVSEQTLTQTSSKSSMWSSIRKTDFQEREF